MLHAPAISSFPCLEVFRLVDLAVPVTYHPGKPRRQTKAPSSIRRPGTAPLDGSSRSREPERSPAAPDRES
jgi:hypothetical protein